MNALDGDRNWWKGGEGTSVGVFDISSAAIYVAYRINGCGCCGSSLDFEGIVDHVVTVRRAGRGNEKRVVPRSGVSSGQRDGGIDELEGGSRPRWKGRG